MGRSGPKECRWGDLESTKVVDGPSWESTKTVEGAMRNQKNVDGAIWNEQQL